MSCNEWEEGTIKLPTGEAPKVRDAVKHAADQHRAALYAHAQAFWKALPAAYRRDREKYGRAVEAYLYGNLPSTHPNDWRPKGLPDAKLPAWRGLPDDAGHPDRSGMWSDLHHLLTLVLRRQVKVEGKPWAESQECPPHRALQTDVEKVIGKATGTKFRLDCGESSIAFDGRTLVWAVGENNHARDYGRAHPIARALFAALDRVTWTRGSGGDIVGNDEYNRDNRDSGGGGNYVLNRYGPERAPRGRSVLTRGR